MQLIADTVDFSQYLKEPPEANRVIPASQYVDDVLQRLAGTQTYGATLPWEKTHNDIRLRPGEVSIFAGVNGHGKSLVSNQICLGLMRQGERVCIASMEMKPVVTMLRFCRQFSATNQPSDPIVRQIHRWTDGKLWMYDQQGTVNADRILAVARYCADKLKITHFVIDSLMKCGIGVDDYNRQKMFVDKLCAHAKDTGQHIHLIAHARKGESERQVIDKFDIKGASEITDQVDNVFSVWRNKTKEESQRNGDSERDGEPDALLVCSKQRNGEWEGRISLHFHPASLQYTETSGRPIPYYLAL